MMEIRNQVLGIIMGRITGGRGGREAKKDDASLMIQSTLGYGLAERESLRSAWTLLTSRRHLKGGTAAKETVARQ